MAGFGDGRLSVTRNKNYKNDPLLINLTTRTKNKLIPFHHSGQTKIRGNGKLNSRRPNCLVTASIWMLYLLEP